VLHSPAVATPTPRRPRLPPSFETHGNETPSSHPTPHLKTPKTPTHRPPTFQVGAATEAELEDRKLRVEDAKNATFAAVEEGVVPGGGAALLHLSELVPAFRETLADEEERLGADIVMKALRAPARTIADNAGVEGEVIVQRLLGQPFAVGYNAMVDRVEDLLAAGVIDPAKVTRNGLQNSCSIAGIMLTTQAVMVERAKPAGAPGGSGPGGMPSGMTI
jgi:chaperonin GroEL (HSP60 family)